MTTRIAVHPMIVAAALGLLGPAAMADDLDDGEFLSIDDGTAAPSGDVVVDPAEFARVEAEWFAVRGLKVD